VVPRTGAPYLACVKTDDRDDTALAKGAPDGDTKGVRHLEYARDNLYRDQHGAYHTKFKIGGKRIKRALKTTDRKLAERLRDDLMKKCRKKAFNQESGKLTFAEVAKAWLGSKVGEVKEKTHVRLAGVVKALTAAFGSHQAGSIVLRQVEAWRTKRIPEVAPRTFNKELETLNAIFVYGQEVFGAVDENPCDKTKRIKRIDAHKPVIPTKEQFRELLRELRASNQAVESHSPEFCELLAYTGLRVGEALKIGKHCVNFELETVRIIPGKGRAERMLPLFAPLKDLFTRIWDWERPEGAKQLFQFSEDNGIRTALTLACERAGLSRFTHHHLRHFFCSNAIEAGIDFKTIAAWFGHKDGGALVARTYGHLRDVHSAAMAKLITFSA
jgi:integrase